MSPSSEQQHPATAATSDQGAVEPAATPTLLRWLTVAICGGAIMTAIVSVESDSVSRLAVVSWAVAAVAVTVLAGFAARWVKVDRLASMAGPAVVLAYLASPAAEPLIRFFGYGRALELVLFEGLLATLPVFAFAAASKRWVPLGGTASLFTVLFSVCLLANAAVAILAAGWTLLAVVWLTFVVKDRSVGEQIGVVTRRRNAWAMYGPIALLAIVVAAATTGRDSLSFSRGFLASSGGDGRGSEFARSGVGDGDALVAATKHVESFGPIEDAPFAQSHDPSLYDLFDDTYGETQPVKNSDRAMSLEPENVLPGDRHLSETEAAAREFSTLRKPRQGRRGGVDDLSSAAMFYVAGRVPLHLRMQVLENFDGVKWSEGEARVEHLPPIEFATVNDEPWLKVPRPSAAFEELFSRPEAHALKPVHFDETRIPLPPNATGVHIAEVDRESMFEWVQEDILRMQRKRLAKLVPIHVASRRIDYELIDDAIPAVAVGGRPELHALPTHPEMDKIHELAKSWAEGTNRGWDQVEQIIQRLRAHAVVDRSAVASADSDFPVAEFLFESRRGPDYQFATAACLMLRSLGYSSRVVGGFYASPTKYDAKGRHTFVDGEDVHVWCEVRLSGNCWATVEPTPGYEILMPPRSLWYRLSGFAKQAAIAAANRWFVFVAAFAIMLIGWWQRVALIDVWRSTRIRFQPRRATPDGVWRVLEHRLDAIYPAPPGWTARRRIDQLPAPAEIKSALTELVSKAEAGVFAGEASRSHGVDTNLGQCLDQVTLNQLKRWRTNIDYTTTDRTGRQNSEPQTEQ